MNCTDLLLIATGSVLMSQENKTTGELIIGLSPDLNQGSAYLNIVPSWQIKTAAGITQDRKS